MTLGRCCTAILLGGLSWAGAHGGVDDGPPDAEELMRYQRWGALRSRPRLRLLDAGWDSNVFYSKQQTGDYRATLAPGLDGLILFGDQAFLRFDSELRYTAYETFSSLNHLDLRNAARVNFLFGRSRAYVGGGFDRVRRTPVDADDVRPAFVTRYGEAGTILQSDGRGSVELALAYRDLTHQGDDFDMVVNDVGARLDRAEVEARTVYRRAVGGRTEVSLEASGSKVEFDRPNVGGIPGFGRDSTQLRVLPVLTLSEGGSWSGRIQVGYTTLESASASLGSYSGTIGRAQLRYRPFRAVTWRLMGTRDVGFSLNEDDYYYVRESVRLHALCFASSFIGLELGMERGDLEFPATSRVDDLDEYWGGVRFLARGDHPDRRVEYRIKAGRRERDSGDPRRDWSRSTITIEAVFGY